VFLEVPFFELFFLMESLGLIFVRNFSQAARNILRIFNLFLRIPEISGIFQEFQGF
jgi:hypothetical protein